MNNLSNGDSIINQIITDDNHNVEEEINTDPEQLARDIKYLRAELNFKTKQIYDQFELLYSLEQKKDTYDNIVTMKSIKFYEN